MKITLSKSQWEFIGRKTGWIKTAQTVVYVVTAVKLPNGKVVKAEPNEIYHSQIINRLIDKEEEDDSYGKGGMDVFKAFPHIKEGFIDHNGVFYTRNELEKLEERLNSQEKEHIHFVRWLPKEYRQIQNNIN